MLEKTKNRYSIWAELPSPLKADFYTLFQEYCAYIYKKDGVILTSYIPSEMAGSMPPEDYLIRMEDLALPECYVTMSYGECSSKKFVERFLETGIYRSPEIFGYFPECMVVDTRRLGERPIPETYEQLCDPVYQGEVCLIGNKLIPDPMVSLHIYRTCGKKEMRQFIKNVGCFASPVDTIRHIGKESNRFGSIFIMPSLFANVCADKRNAKIVIPKQGMIAEPIICMKHCESDRSAYIEEFLFSAQVKQMLDEKNFISALDDSGKIHERSKEAICPELEEVFSDMKEILCV